MKPLLLRCAEGVLALGAALFLAGLLIPRTSPRLDPPAVAADTSLRSDAPEPRAARQAVSTDAVISLFVPKAQRRAASVAAVRTLARKPVEAPWLTYLGFYAASPGEPYHLVKDTRTGRVIRVPERGATGGWSVLAEEGTMLIVGNGDEVLILRKR